MLATRYVQVATPRFVAVSPDLLKERTLLRRTDTKFVVSRSQVEALLPLLSPDYGVLQAAGASLARYRTLYFDTPGLRCFHDHRRGRRPRHKIRVRHYADRAVGFVEVKTKRGQRLTDKKRRAISYGATSLSAADRRFIAAHCDVPPDELVPQVWTAFQRLTLLGLRTNERITIDVDLEYSAREAVHRLPAVAIVEVKQSPYDARTPVMRSLRAAGIRPASASKYCTAIALDRPELRMNRLRPALRAMARMARTAA